MDVYSFDRYTLTIEIFPVRIVFTLSDTTQEQSPFRYVFDGKDLTTVFAQFKEAYFDNSFFAFPLKNIRIINYLSKFTLVPRLLFDEKQKEKQMRFLFSSIEGKILAQTLQQPEIVILHELPKEIADFFQRTFSEAQLVHCSGELIHYYAQLPATRKTAQMYLYQEDNQLYITCFSSEKLLLCNSFESRNASESLYYILYIWKQLKFDQRNDLIHIPEGDLELIEKVRPYIAQIQTLSANFRTDYADRKAMLN